MHKMTRMRGLTHYGMIYLIAIFLVSISGQQIIDAHAWFGSDLGSSAEEWKDYLAGIAVIVSSITAGLTALFVALLYKQNKHQKKIHDLTVRPIIVKDKDSPYNSIQLVINITSPRLIIQLVNVGSIHTAKARIMILPLDRYSKFMEREKALGKYLDAIGDGILESNNLCILQRPIIERMKLDKEEKSHKYFLILGSDLERMRPIVKKFEDVLANIDDKEKRKEFTEAGRDLAASMSKLSPSDWDAFYLSGDKRSDFLDRIGPVDWEMFDEKLGKNKIRELLGDMADEVYNAAPRRAKILADMDKIDRERYDAAIKRRLDIWGMLPDKILEEFARTSMDIRRTYRDTKDVFSQTTNMIPPGHPIEKFWFVSKDNIADIKSGEHLYFGVRIQYSRPEGKGMEYSYYLRGSIINGKVRVDDIQD